MGMEVRLERELMANNRMVYKLDGTYFMGILQDINSELEGESFDNTFGVTVSIGGFFMKNCLIDCCLPLRFPLLYVLLS